MAQPADPLNPPEGASDELLLATLTAALVAGSALSVFERILSRFTGIGSAAAKVLQELGGETLLRSIANELAILGRDNTPAGKVLHGTVTRNAIRKAAYLVMAGRRLAPALTSRDQGRLEQARIVEQRYKEAHERAERLRSEAAFRIVEQIADRGTDRKGEILLGWKATLDSRTSADCRWANGRNFNALVPPVIGYPGTVHESCRCRAGAPYPTRKRVERGTIPAHD